MTDQLSNLVEHTAQAHGVRRPSAEVECTPAHPAYRTEDAAIGGDSIIDMEDVTHLAAIAINGDCFATQCSNEKMRYPPLVLGAMLMRPVDTAHAQDGRLQTIGF